jgi:hypothetical protein
MRDIKLLNLCLTVVLAICAIAATQASATEYIYKVEGTTLGAGQTKEITANAGTEFTFTSKGAFEIEAIVKCRELKLSPAEKSIIVGGTPGTSSIKIEYEICTATVGGTRCEKVTFTYVPLEDQIVTAASNLIGKIVDWFKPKTGKVMMTSKLTKCGIFGSQEVTIEGTTAALVSPEKSEQVANALIWSAAEEITEIEKSNGTREKVGLKANSKLATFDGKMEIELVSKEKWGVF